MTESPRTEFTPPPPVSGRHVFYAQWGLISIFWLLIAMANLLESSLYNPYGVTYAWRSVAMQWLPWILLTPVIMWLASAFTIERLTWHRNIWVHLAACVVIVGGLGTVSYLQYRQPASRESGPSFGPPESQPFGGGFRGGRPDANGMAGPTNFPGERGGAWGGGRGPDWTGSGGGPDWTGMGRTGGPQPQRGGENRLPWRDGGRFGGPGNGSYFMPFPMGPPTAFIIVNMSTLQLPTFWAVLGIAHALVFYRRAKDRERRGIELEARLNQSRLQTLRMQINPHFLFNTLNSISSLVYDQPRTADEMIGSLSDLLRLTLNTSHRQEVTLREELDFLGQYLFIEQTRFGDRLKIEQNIEPAALDTLVPSLILQPLVENAFKHGVEAQLGPGVIVINARRAGDALVLEIADNGRGLAGATGGRLSEGVGLTNTRARLRGLYRDHASLEYGPRPEGGFRVAVQIPWRTEANPPAGYTVAKS
jgi:two-component sensor histidine kinase